MPLFFSRLGAARRAAKERFTSGPIEFTNGRNGPERPLRPFMNGPISCVNGRRLGVYFRGLGHSERDRDDELPRRTGQDSSKDRRSRRAPVLGKGAAKADLRVEGKVEIAGPLLTAGIFP